MPQPNEIKYGKEIGYKGSHKYIWQSCVGCGKERWVQLHKGIPDARVCLHCIPAHRGGRFIQAGYVVMQLQPDDLYFPMAKSNHYILEHRLVMAKHLGRCLKPWEVVHHINGIRDDNRLENLELLAFVKDHLPDTVIKSRLGCLEAQVKRQSKEIKLLQWQIGELNKIQALPTLRQE